MGTLLVRNGASRYRLTLLAALLAGTTGCVGLQTNWLKPNQPAEAPTDSFVLRGEGLVEDKMSPVTGEPRNRLDAGLDHFRREEYGKAEDIFVEIIDGSKSPPNAVQEAMYYRAECERMQNAYPSACDHYSELMQKFPNNPYKEQALQRMFDIANYWLNDTRAEMREDMERKQGKRWVVVPRFVSFEKSKPLMDREGRAIDALEKVRLYDINGPLADQALFLCGTVQLYHENYREADHYFSQITHRHPESPQAQKALEMAIFCKQMSTGGSDYDGRTVAEARKLVQTAMLSYPKLAEEKKEQLNRHLASIDLQQAEKDFKMAEFYERTGHPGSAYWYYDLVHRRYPHTKLAGKAAERRDQLRAKAEKEMGPLSHRPTGAKKPGAGPSTNPALTPQAGNVGNSWLPPPTLGTPQTMSPGSPPLPPGSPPLPPGAGLPASPSGNAQ